MWANPEVIRKSRRVLSRRLGNNSLLKRKKKSKQRVSTPLAQWSSLARRDFIRSPLLCLKALEFYSKARSSALSLIKHTQQRRWFDRNLILQTMREFVWIPGFSGRDWTSQRPWLSMVTQAMQIMGDWVTGEFTAAGKKKAGIELRLLPCHQANKAVHSNVQPLLSKPCLKWTGKEKQAAQKDACSFWFLNLNSKKTFNLNKVLFLHVWTCPREKCFDACAQSSMDAFLCKLND